MATRGDAQLAYTVPTTWPNDWYVEYHSTIFSDTPVGATSSAANARTQATRAARQSCLKMEHAAVDSIDNVNETVYNALRTNLSQTYPDALIHGRQEATHVVTAIVDEFRRMALEPAKHPHATSM